MVYILYWWLYIDVSRNPVGLICKDQAFLFRLLDPCELDGQVFSKHQYKYIATNLQCITTQKTEGLF